MERDMTDILIVEDDPELGTLVRDFIRNEGFSAELCADAEKALVLLKKESYRMVLLDIMLPGMDGFETCTAIRSTSNIPIMMMSSLSDEESKLTGYDTGADDYIDKPFSVRVLIAKIRALLKRGESSADGGSVIRSCGIELDRDCFTEPSTVSVHIRWLREKIEKDPNSPALIRTVWKYGYIFGEKI